MQTAAYSLPSADLGRVQTWQRCSCLTMQCCTILSTVDSTQYSTQYSTFSVLMRKKNCSNCILQLLQHCEAS